MRRCLIAVVLILIIVGEGFAQKKKKSEKANWRLVWSDEFEYRGLPDSAKWSFEEGDHGWGNNELQYYTSADTANAIVKDGELYITARKKQKGKAGYTSARIVSKGKGDWLYGKIEARAMLPAGRGLWPAIWMLPTDWKYGGWPASGEIDIMEHVGFTPDSVYGSVHTKKFNHVLGTQTTKGYRVVNPYSAFHNYTIIWDRAKIDFYVDNTHYLTFKNTGNGSEEWPFDERFHLLLNVAVGGGWGGLKGIDDSVFPQSMVVDYIRVYQKQ